MEIKETTTKSYGSDKVGDWNLDYQWESANGAKPAGVKVTGNNGTGGFINGDISQPNTNISFGGGAAFDLEVTASILATVAEVNATFESAGKGK
ncbi:hypothetical protein [Pedobacter jejuensis]|uniref:Uncharacterized protein n=1 Tax=Pedobacter jejuensis TaxID=1268550 RepID=A0A3N0BPD3_9SPHI|nr:hypothetical protein [Pedobacter jejuensis]RNL50761.1 hypothetical protein D7004_17895 [Pedobacter jejuensis]